MAHSTGNALAMPKGKGNARTQRGAYFGVGTTKKPLAGFQINIVQNQEELTGFSIDGRRQRLYAGI